MDIRREQHQRRHLQKNSPKEGTTDTENPGDSEGAINIFESRFADCRWPEGLKTEMFHVLSILCSSRCCNGLFRQRSRKIGCQKTAAISGTVALRQHQPPGAQNRRLVKEEDGKHTEPDDALYKVVLAALPTTPELASQGGPDEGTASVKLAEFADGVLHSTEQTMNSPQPFSTAFMCS